MTIGEKIHYNGHKLDTYQGETDLVRRIEDGEVSNIFANGWIEITLQSGYKVAMAEERMNICIIPILDF